MQHVTCCLGPGIGDENESNKCRWDEGTGNQMKSTTQVYIDCIRFKFNGTLGTSRDRGRRSSREQDGILAFVH